MAKDFFILAFKNLTNRKLRSWLTMIGIFIGIAAIVSLIGLGEGLRFAITSQFGFLGTDVLSVQAEGISLAGPPGTGSPAPLEKELIEKVRKVNGVDAAFGRYIATATAEFNNKQIIGMAWTMPEGDDRKIVEKMLNLQTESGRILKEGDIKKIIIGNSIAGEDTFGKTIKSGDRILLNDIYFDVVGVLERKGSFLVDNAIIVNEGPLLDFLREDDGTVNIIAVKLKDQDQMDDVQEDLEKMLRKERDVKVGEEDFIVESPQKILDSLNSTLFAVQLFIYIIAGISLLVGGIGITNTMYTAVLERTKEIGIMKSVGAKNNNIFTIFFIEAGLLGMVGGLIGIILGVSAAKGFAYAGSMALGSGLIQAHISTGLIVGTLIFSMGIGLIAGTLPALQASKKHPVDALRFSK